MRLGFKVSGSVGNFSMIYGDSSLSVPEIPVLLPTQVSTFSAPRDSVLLSRQAELMLELQWPVGPLAMQGASALGCAVESCPWYFTDPLFLLYFRRATILHMACFSCSPHPGGGTGWHHAPLYRTESTSRLAFRTCTPL